MPIIIVTVLHDDEPVSGKRVVLEVSGITHGTLGPKYTDSDGRAYFEVEYGEEGIVYVDGSNEGHWGSYSATDIIVYL